ncbi:MAG: serine hydrolase domain-containing protein [Candidatus Binataceae bacterium]
MAELKRAREIVERGIVDGLHAGAQLYVSRGGATVADLGLGEARAGVPMTPDTIMLWMSSGKPITAIAIGQMLERGKLDVDDRVARHIPEFGTKGKEAITIRHVLTHTGGFPNAVRMWSGAPWEAIIAELCDAPLEPGWAIGSDQGYHVASGWYALAEIVRRIDGRPYWKYVREEIFEPLGMEGTWIGMPAERYAEFEKRIAPMHSTATSKRPEPHPFPFWGASREALGLCRPGGSAHGPIHDLGRFYDAMLAGGGGIVKAQTMEKIATRQTEGRVDRNFGYQLDRGLGVVIDSKQYGRQSAWFGTRCSSRAWGHAGYMSSVGFADPVNRVVVALVFNGMLEAEPGKHDERAREVIDAVYEELGIGV